MAAPSIGTTARTQDFRIEAASLPAWAHPEVKYWYDEWRLIRDMSAGEKEVKEQTTRYLPKLEGMEVADYTAYLDRSTYYPFTGRTAGALSGSIFRRRESFENFPDRLVQKLESFGREGQDFLTFATFAAEEVIKMGRFGALIDLPNTPSTEPRPYLTYYTAENIIDWEDGEVDGRKVPTRIVLREARMMTDPKSFAKQYVPVYRELILIGRDRGRHYEQRVYAGKQPGDNVTITPEYRESTTIPEVRGKLLDYIPFRLFGAFTSSIAIEKPPMQDIARMNRSHYLSYAYLEHGRFFTGFPIYYVEAAVGSSESDAEFRLGSSNVWVTPPGAKPGILEMNGQGLKFLTDALDQKEQQAAALGGRMMGVRGTAVAESDNMVKLSERNEQSVLLKITRSMDAGFTQLLRWWASMQDVPKEQADKIRVEFNKDFLFDGIGAREFRAIHSMYKDGVLPIEVVYHYLKKGMIIPDWMSLEEFKELLDKMESFPNNADVEARSEGFADAKSRDQFKLQEEALGHETDLQDTSLDHELTVLDEEQTFQNDQKKLDRKSAEKQAALAPKVVPGAPGAPGAKKPAAKPKAPAK